MFNVPFRSLALSSCLYLLAGTVFAQTDNVALLERYQAFYGRLVNAAQVAICNRLSEKYIYASTDSATKFAEVALMYAKKLKLPKEQAHAYVNIGRASYISGSFFKSLIYADSGMVMSKELNYAPGLAGALNTRGLIYLAQNRFADAKPEFRKALVYNQQLKDSARIAANYFNIGLCHDELHQNDEAFEYLDKALQVAKQCGNKHMQVMALNRIGEVNFHLKAYDKALSYYRSALKLADTDDNWEHSFGNSGTARTLYAMGKHAQALQYGQKAYNIARQLNAKWDIERAVNIIAKCYAALGDFKQGFHFQELSRTYADSLMNEHAEQEINYLHLQERKAENQQLLSENEQHKQDIRNQRIINWLIASFALILIVVLFVLRRSNVIKNKLNIQLTASNHAIADQKTEIEGQQKELMALNQTKDRVLSVIGHDLRSPFASVLPALELMNSSDLDEHEQKMIMENFHRQVVLVSGLTNNLLTWANSQREGMSLSITRIDLAVLATEVLTLYQAVYEQKQQHVHHEPNGEVFIMGDKQHVRIILQNIISNAIKFTPKDGSINVSYTSGPEFTAIHIKDTGMGMSAKKLELLFTASGSSISEKGTDNELGTGLGLLLIKQFAEENGGHIEVDSSPGDGSEFRVYFRTAVRSVT